MSTASRARSTRCSTTRNPRRRLIDGGHGMKRLLVVANETVGGTALIDAVKKHAEGGDVKVTVICPQNEPKGGWVIYDDAARGAADNRLQTTLAQLREIGIEADGEVMDPDPYAATMDAIHAFGADEVIISTHPETRSGWMRKDLVSRIEEDSGLPVEHVVVDLDAEREDVDAHARRGEPDGRVGAAARADRREEPRGRPPVHGHRPGQRRRGRPARAARAPAEAPRGRGHPGGRPGRPPGPVHRDPERDAVLRRGRHPHLDVRGRALGMAAGQPVERVKAATSKPVEHIVSTREKVES